MFAAIYHDGNECSWSADYVLGILSTRPLADGAILTDFETSNEDRELDRYENKEIILDQLWD